MEKSGYKIGVLFGEPETRIKFLEGTRIVYGKDKRFSINVRKCTLSFKNGSFIKALTPGMLDSKNENLVFDEIHYYDEFSPTYIDNVVCNFLKIGVANEQIESFLDGFSIVE